MERKMHLTFFWLLVAYTYEIPPYICPTMDLSIFNAIIYTANFSPDLGGTMDRYTVGAQVVWQPHIIHP